MQLVFTARVVTVALSFNLNFLVPLAIKVPDVKQQLLPPPFPFFNLFTRKEYGGTYILICPHGGVSELSHSQSTGKIRRFIGLPWSRLQVSLNRFK